nr:chalcone isomerase family protein [Candidatus Cloacimonadota bacterium]
MRKICLIVVVLLCLLSILEALEIGGKNLPDKILAGDTELQLNGAGLRKKLIIKVYAGALYLTQKSHDAAQIAAADEPMAIRMHFIYKKVEPEKLIEAWNTGFAKSDVSNLQNEIAAFNAWFRQDALKDDVYEMIYIPGNGTSLYINDILQGTLP